MMKTRLLAVLLIVFVALPFAAAAQGDAGQLWIRSFEDRDGDGTRDPNEPLLSKGVTVELMRDGVVIASALLDDAPYASQGLIGFQFLSPGEYTLHMAAGMLNPTTPDSVTVTVGGTGLPPVIEFGGQALTAVETTNSASDLLAGLPLPKDPEVMRLVVSALGGVIAAGIAAFFGFLIYTFTLRPRYRAALKAAKRATSTTATMRAVVVEETPDEAKDEDGRGLD